jgi:hypothetical protein
MVIKMCCAVIYPTVCDAPSRREDTIVTTTTTDNLANIPHRLMFCSARHRSPGGGPNGN